MKCPICHDEMLEYRIKDEREMAIHFLDGHYLCIKCRQLYYQAMGVLLDQFIWELAFVEV